MTKKYAFEICVYIWQDSFKCYSFKLLKQCIMVFITSRKISNYNHLLNVC